MGKGKLSAGIVLLAFVLSALIPFFAVYDTAAYENQQATPLFGEKVLLCTSEGFQWVDIEDLQNGKEHPKPHPDFDCALCVAVAHGLKSVMQVAGATVTYAPFASPFDYLPSFRLAAVQQHASGGVSSRAPPFPVTT